MGLDRVAQGQNKTEGKFICRDEPAGSVNLKALLCKRYKMEENDGTQVDFS